MGQVILLTILFSLCDFQIIVKLDNLFNCPNILRLNKSLRQERTLLSFN